ncbi:alpha/beta hydrolase [Dictyobacter arantiisoli]|uniref:alpha/beta hydrolase n=1 Tax=Dictyobacter arantiisoli TaxID=2014874 RepID=UPI001C0EEDDF|nr:alpha/beta hydrolase [Dictyobacter arantiisoli]
MRVAPERELNVGPVHLTGQGISGATVFRLAATHPEDVLSFTAIETGLPGFGAERLADVTHGGTWYIGVLVAPHIPEMLLTGREREFFGQFIFPAMSVTPGAITKADIDEFVRTYSRPRRLARSDWPLPVDAPGGRRHYSSRRHSQTEHACAGNRSQRR